MRRSQPSKYHQATRCRSARILEAVVARIWGFLPPSSSNQRRDTLRQHLHSCLASRALSRSRFQSSISRVTIIPNPPHMTIHSSSPIHLRLALRNCPRLHLSHSLPCQTRTPSTPKPRCARQWGSPVSLSDGPSKKQVSQTRLHWMGQRERLV